MIGFVIAAGAWFRRRKTASATEHVAFAAIVSGALGNGADRVLRGYVVDFIHVSFGTHFDWPIFNVADIAVTVGVALLLLVELRRRRTEPPPPLTSI
jgi:signal peptidase II